MNNIKQARINVNFSQQQLATLVGVTQKTISRWENGEVEPAKDDLEKIADVLCVSTDYLLGKEGSLAVYNASKLAKDVIEKLTKEKVTMYGKKFVSAFEDKNNKIEKTVELLLQISYETQIEIPFVYGLLASKNDALQDNIYKKAMYAFAFHFIGSK